MPSNDHVGFDTKILSIAIFQRKIFPYTNVSEQFYKLEAHY